MKLVKDFRTENGWFLGNAAKGTPLEGGPLQVAHKVGPVAGRSKPHHHKNNHEYFIVLAGYAVLEVNEEVISLQIGTVVMIEPGDVHRIFRRSEDFEFLAIMPKYVEGDTHEV